jgi:hypothetical protein
MTKVMHEYKHHELKSGGRRPVKSRKQAIAIGLSEARRAGADIPENPSKKKSASKKRGGKKTATKKKSTGRKRASRKSTKK